MASRMAPLDVSGIIGSRCRFGQQGHTPTKAHSRAMPPESAHPIEVLGLISGHGMLETPPRCKTGACESSSSPGVSHESSGRESSAA